MKQPCILILAAGEGTRLRSLDLGVPKPMAPIAGRPFLEHLILKLKGFGFQSVVIALSRNNRGIRSALGSGRDLGIRLRYTEERVAQGTGAAIRNALPSLPRMFYVINGDTFIDFNPMVLSQHPLAHKARATIALLRKSAAGRYGSVTLSKEGRVRSFREKGLTGPGLVYAGAALLHRNIFSGMVPMTPFSFEQNAFPRLAKRGLLAGLRVRGNFRDIGTPRSYRAFERQWKQR